MLLLGRERKSMKKCKFETEKSLIDYSQIDEGCRNLCKAINKIPNIITIESYSGHKKDDMIIFFKTRSIKDLPDLLYWFDGCHCGFYNWKVLVYTDCGRSPATFFINGIRNGKEVHNLEKQSEHIAELIIKDNS